MKLTQLWTKKTTITFATLTLNPLDPGLGLKVECRGSPFCHTCCWLKKKDRVREGGRESEREGGRERDREIER